MTERGYRVLCRLLPRDFRDRWAGEMWELLRWRLSRASGPVDRVRIGFRAVADLVTAAVAMRLERTNGGAADGPRARMTSGGGGDVRFDFVQAVRSLMRTPTFTVTAVGTLALGIGGVVATFSIFHSVLQRPLPYDQPGELVAVWPDNGNFNVAMVREANASIPALEGVSGISSWTLLLQDVERPTELEASRVAPGHFELLRTPPFLGRTFRPEESDETYSDKIILSWGLWQRAFGGDASVLGRRIRISGGEHNVREIIGIMPEGFRPVWGQPEAWIPIASDPSLGLRDDGTWWVNWRIGRLAPGATVEQADAQVRAFAQRMRDEFPSRFSEEEIAAADVQPLAEWLTRDLGLPLRLAMGAVALVLLIACVNVSSLVLARSDARVDQLAIRAAIGASRGGLLRLVLLESLVVSGIAAILGVALSHLVVGGIVRVAPAELVRYVEVAVSGPALLLAVGLVLLTALAAGVVPALRASHASPLAAMGRSRGSAGRRRGRLTSLLVAGQIALAMVVVTGSGLMLRSLASLLSEEVGMRTEGVLSFRPALPEYPSAEEALVYHDRLLARLTALDEVEAASGIHLLPGTRSNWSFPTYPEGHSYRDDETVASTNFRYVRPRYFEVMGIDLLRGREIEESDGSDGEAVAVVNQAFVDRWWPGEDPIGRTVRVFSEDDPPMRIVGVVGNVRQFGLANAPRPEIYAPQRQAPWQVELYILVRFRDGRTTEYGELVRAIATDVDPAVAVEDVEAMDAVYGSSAESTRFITLVLAGFGVLALGLGAVGVFGVTATAVGQRTGEFGVRRALGSTSRQVVAVAVREAGRPVLIGFVLGLVASALSVGLIEGLVYGIRPFDPLTLVAVSVTLLVTSGVAALIPARRAGRVDPASVLDRG